MTKNSHLLFLADNTLLGGAREGFAVSEDRLYWKNNMFSKPGVVSLSQLAASEFINEKAEVTVRSLDGSHDEFSISAALLDADTIRTVLEAVKKVAIEKRRLQGDYCPYLMPRNPNTLLAKLQMKGFLVRQKSHMVRDFLLYCVILLAPILLLKGDMATPIACAICTAGCALLYLIYYYISGGIIYMWVACAILGVLGAVIPPLGALLAFCALVMALVRIKKLLMMLPWVILGLPIYYIMFRLNKDSTQPQLIAYGCFFLALALFVTSRYGPRKGLYNMALAFGTLPLIIALVFLSDSDDMDMDGDDLDLADGIVDLDGDGVLRIEFPDRTCTWVESDVIASHWRTYMK